MIWKYNLFKYLRVKCQQTRHRPVPDAKFMLIFNILDHQITHFLKDVAGRESDKRDVRIT